MAAIVAFGGVVLTATASAGAAPVRLYTVATAEACVKGLPDAIAGLPPATPPVTPVLFVYSSRPSHLPRPMSGQLGVWYGQRPTGAYAEVTLSYFKSLQIARAFFTPLSGASLVRNVVVTWDHATLSGGGWRRAVRDCVRAAPPSNGGAVTKRAVPRASLPTFVGHWGGHGRGLSVTSRGQGDEGANSGCCVRVYEMTFQILSVSGTLTRATATYRVTYFKRYDRFTPRLRVGQVGQLLLRNGIVTNTLTKDYFCSNPAWGATGACGA
jgi:hypothetical protein